MLSGFLIKFIIIKQYLSKKVAQRKLYAGKTLIYQSINHDIDCFDFNCYYKY